MFCENCGKRIDDGAMFCENCGASVKNNQRSGQYNNQYNNQYNGNSQGPNMGQTIPNVSDYMGGGKKQKANTNTIIIIVAVFVVVLALAVTGIVLMRKDKEKKQEAMNELYSITQDTEESGDEYVPSTDVEEYELPEYEEPEYNYDYDYDYEYEEQEALDNSLEYILYGSDSRYISESELYSLTATECRLARNEIYARHGRMFNDDMLQNYFNAKSWYYPSIAPDDFNEGILNKYEKENVKTIKQYEKEQGY